MVFYSPGHTDVEFDNLQDENRFSDLTLWVTTNRRNFFREDFMLGIGSFCRILKTCEVVR